MNQYSKITSKGQTTIPAEIRAELGVGPGDRLEFVSGTNGQVTIRKAQSGLEALRGVVKLGRPVSDTEIAEAIKTFRGSRGMILDRG
jgi:antitoxin PrlF